MRVVKRKDGSRTFLTPHLRVLSSGPDSLCLTWFFCTSPICIRALAYSHLRRPRSPHLSQLLGWKPSGHPSFSSAPQKSLPQAVVPPRNGPTWLLPPSLALKPVWYPRGWRPRPFSPAGIFLPPPTHPTHSRRIIYASCCGNLIL